MGARHVAVVSLLLSGLWHGQAFAQAVPTSSTSTAAPLPTDAELLLRLDAIDIADQKRQAALGRRLEVVSRRFEATSARFNAVERAQQELAARAAELAPELAALPEPEAPEPAPEPPPLGRRGRAQRAELEAARREREGLERKRRSLQARMEGLEVERRVLGHELSYLRRELDLLLQRKRAIRKQLDVLEAKEERKQEARGFLTGDIEPPLRTEPSDADPVDLRDRVEIEAERALERQLAVVHRLERRAWLTDQLSALDREELRLVSGMGRAARESQRLLSEESEVLKEDLQQLQASDASPKTLLSLRRRIYRLRQLIAETSSAIVEDQETAELLRARVEQLAAVRAPIEPRIEAAAADAESARRYLAFISSPLAPHRLLRWARTAGPRILGYLVLLGATWLMFRLAGRRVVASFVGTGHAHTPAERLDRIDTIFRAAKNGARIALLVAAALLVLPEFGVDVGVLLGSAAVFSLALAFGAQSLVKDYFSGVMVLLEDQYRVGNVVTINGHTGTVEDITLRLTTLRGLNGAAHFIPHGQIDIVSNLTHGFSRALLDIGVAYKENVDRVIEVLETVATELYEDDAFRGVIIEPPAMLGVDALDDSAVVVRMLITTAPLEQWRVKREMLRRVKGRFDELGIEIPFPHRTIVYGGGSPEPSRAASVSASGVAFPVGEDAADGDGPSS